MYIDFADSLVKPFGDSLARCGQGNRIWITSPGGRPPRAGLANAIALTRGGENGRPATVTESADLWLIDRHRLLCADPLDLTAVDRMLEGERLVLVAFEPAPCDRIVHRFRQLTGQDATLAASGQQPGKMRMRVCHLARTTVIDGVILSRQFPEPHV